MEYRILGKTGLKISRLGFGGIPIQRVDAKITEDIVSFLEKQGINFIDTARGYTVSEEYLGKALVGKREKFILATKSMARTKEAMEKDIEISLNNLRTDYIDLYQVHNPTPEQLKQVAAPGGALEALQEAKSNGKIGHIGVTAHSLEVFSLALSFEWVETVMFPYNIVETQGEELIRKCKEKNVGFICMKPLAGGAIDNHELAIRFTLSNPSVDTVIPGMASVQEAQSNLKAAQNTSPLSDKEQSECDKIIKELGTNFCRRCNYCQPCTAGISIYSMFLMEGYYTRYKLEDWAKSRYYAFDKTASDCVDCGLCEERCPYNLPIRKMLKTVAERFGK